MSNPAEKIKVIASKKKQIFSPAHATSALALPLQLPDLLFPDFRSSLSSSWTRC
jgi:hypothetical protein